MSKEMYKLTCLDSQNETKNEETLTTEDGFLSDHSWLGHILGRFIMNEMDWRDKLVVEKIEERSG